MNLHTQPPQMQNLILCSLLFLFFSCTSDVDYTSAQWLSWSKDTVSFFPENHWKKYSAPEEAGWSGDKLAEARRFWEASQSAAFLVIYDGVVLVAWGETDRRFFLHSVRKSLTNVMYGVAVDAGLVNLNATLNELQITENTPLNAQESGAKVLDLIQSKSGIYRPAAYSLNKKLPKRGSAKPGQKWHYNNWDFNVCETILAQQTGRPIAAYFDEQIAKPLNLQDFRLMDVYGHKEAISKHPAHPFRMSARDLGRIGLLYLNHGVWKGEQIISSNWITESSRAHSKLKKGVGGNGADYGYLWWVSDDRFKPLGMYYASGLNGQRMWVIPEADLVVVNLVDTYQRHNFPEKEQLQLLDKVLAARVSKPKAKPILQKLESTRTTHATIDSIAAHFLGTYEAPIDFAPGIKKMRATIQYRNEGLVADIEYSGTYKMVKVAENTYVMEDMDRVEKNRFPMKFYLAESGTATFELELALVLNKVVFSK